MKEFNVKEIYNKLKEFQSDYKIIYNLYNYLGFRLIWSKVHPISYDEENKASYRKPSTFILWFIGIYFSIFTLAFTRYEFSLNQQENKKTILYSQINNNIEWVLAEFEKIKDVTIPEKPDLFNPFSIINSLHRKERYYSQDFSLKLLVNWRKYLHDIEIYHRDLNNAHFSLGNFNNSLLDGVLMNSASFTKTTFKQTKFEDSVFDAYCFKCVFDYSTFHESSINNSVFYDTSFKDVKFIEDVDISNSKFSNCKLEEINFTDSIIEDLTIKSSELDSINFKGLNLKNIKITNSIISNSSFENANLTNSDFQNTTFNNVNMKNAILKDIKVNKKDIIIADDIWNTKMKLILP